MVSYRDILLSMNKPRGNSLNGDFVETLVCEVSSVLLLRQLLLSLCRCSCLLLQLAIYSRDYKNKSGGM